MKNKKKIRERPIDYKKTFHIIRDLNKEKINVNNEQLIELNNIEKDLYKVLEYYDSIKKKQIPKTKITEKNEKGNNYINNNIIYKDDNISNINLNNEEYKLNYKLTEYKRPNNYIIYSSSERNRINSTKKEYEAKAADFVFLNFRQNFMKIEELENIIVDLENNVVHNKEEKIDEKKAKEIIETKYTKYKNYADCIITHFKDRRKTVKNSLLRKKWYKDKTFQIRKIGIIKTRKNTQNINESLNKIIEAEKNCKTNVLQIINSLYLKETLEKNLIKIDEYIFSSKCELNKGINISAGRIKENNILKENIEIIRKKLDDKQLLEKKDEINGNNMDNINNKENIISNSNDNRNGNKIKDKNDISIIEGNQIMHNGDFRIIKNYNIKNIIKNKNEPIFPPISLDSLKCKNKNKNRLLNKKSKYRFRIRLNRINKIVLDRYCELKNDFNPFHDSFNKIINNYKKFHNCDYKYNELRKNNFENLLNCYNSNVIQSLPLDESDDDSTTFNTDIEYFKNSYKQFLKLKRLQNV